MLNSQELVPLVAERIPDVAQTWGPLSGLVVLVIYFFKHKDRLQEGYATMMREERQAHASDMAAERAACSVERREFLAALERVTIAINKLADRVEIVERHFQYSRQPPK